MFSRTSIDEANRHLQALYKRVQELEGTIANQHETMLVKEKQIKSQLTEVTRTKDSEIESLKQTLSRMESKVSMLGQQMCEKDAQINSLQLNCDALQNILHFLPDARNWFGAMESANRLMNGVNTSNSSCQSTSPLENGFDGSAEDEEETDDTEEADDNGSSMSTSVSEMARQFAANRRVKHFSISEDEDALPDRNTKDAGQNLKPNQEFYL